MLLTHVQYGVSGDRVAEWLKALYLGLLGLRFEHHQCLWLCLQVYRLNLLGFYDDHHTVWRCHTRGEWEEFIACKQVSDPPWFWNPLQTSAEVKTGTPQKSVFQCFKNYFSTNQNTTYEILILTVRLTLCTRIQLGKTPHKTHHSVKMKP